MCRYLSAFAAPPIKVNAQFEPFEYKKGENFYGIDMEIAKLLADYLEVELVIKDMEFDAVCLTVGQHKCDIAMAGLTVKPASLWLDLQ